MVSSLVLIKQVPLPEEMRVSKDGFMERGPGVLSMINPFCKRALEQALRLKEKVGGTVTVLSMGPPSFEKSLREALSMGVDEAFLLSDKRLAGSDTLATSRALSMAIKKMEEKFHTRFDAIFSGLQSIDGDTGHVGPQVAERLEMNQITYVDNLEPFEDGLRGLRRVEGGYQLVEAPYPTLVTVTLYADTPRGATLRHAIRAKKYEIKNMNIDDIGLTSEEAGIPGSATYVVRVRNVKIERPPCKLFGESNVKDNVNMLLSELIQSTTNG
jgi:electron transfer flavoprotein alpha subunit